VFELGPGASYVDLNFRDVPGIIATGVLSDPWGVALIDPGPTSCLDALRRALAAQGIAVADIRSLLLTHIHLDHAGVAGVLVQENPAIDVYVHERGAGHLVDPSKLIASASRLWGPMMGPLWGAVLPVPSDRVKSLHGDERIRIGSRVFDVAYTPGHASHHVSYFDRANGLAWVGDTAGIRVGGSRFVLAPTPPPDIDLEAWQESLVRIAAWEPASLFLTHFGPAQPARRQLDEVTLRLGEAAEMVRQSLEAGPAEDQQFAAYRDEFARYVRRFVPEHDAALYERAAPALYNWQGLARYWRKRAAR
jgi:glyoxylase-like metal-dependent hydrolase (beta-lactamase superfamily II)